MKIKLDWIDICFLILMGIFIGLILGVIYFEIIYN